MQALALSPEDLVVKALAVGLHRSMRVPTSGPSRALAVGVAGNEAFNALVKRTARLVILGDNSQSSMQ